jgi:hypothetical protein
MQDLIIIAAIAGVIFAVISEKRSKRPTYKRAYAYINRQKRTYSYASKKQIMTNAEARFFESLTHVTGDKYALC